MKKVKATVLDAPDLVAFISLYQGTQPRPFIRALDNRVCFEFAEDVSEAIAAFYANVQVPIADYCKALKFVRSMIFTFKTGGANHGK